MMKRLAFFLIISLGVLACKTQQNVRTNTSTTTPTTIEEPIIVEKRNLDTMVISAPRVLEPEPTPLPVEEEVANVLPKYNATHTRICDLLHTKLDLRFDWQNEKVLGKAYLKLKPFFYPTNVVHLDAKDFELHAVRFNGKGKDLNYEYNKEKITINLGRTYNEDEEFELFIDYTASPAKTGGSDAIRSNQGLFFINPKGEDPKKPQQIWTQGETEWNSRWFPTIDKPNERCTQEMYLTVQDKYTTLSNGLLISSTKNSDGTRTDYWRMDQPHAPYLFMLAVGEYAVVKDKWKDVIVDYYVEPKFKNSAKAIFSNTVEMIDFFSKKLGVKYPWPKYSQIVVRDYVSGAMENTTGVIYGEFVQRDKYELVDNNNEEIVAHELFHHWFGDYVTCESWANLTMNEGFATYSEYLWFEHKYGKDYADYHLLNNKTVYLNSLTNGMHPLIHFAHKDKEDMFDRHSYDKGGAVLHMLRSYVGDEAFWAALNKYLTQNAYSSVEAHNLRLAFEEVTGQDLNWFFNQWYFEQGHPKLNITYGYDEIAGSVSIKVEQTQDPTNQPPIFVLPVAIDIYITADEVMRQNITVNQRQQLFTFPVPGKPKLVNFDAEKVLLAEIEDNKTEEELLFQFYNAPRFKDRFDAINYFQNNESEDAKAKKIFESALKDDFWLIRAFAVNKIDGESKAESLDLLRKIAANDENSNLRALAYDKLSDIQDDGAVENAKQTLARDSVYHALASALYYLYTQKPDEVLAYADKYIETENALLIQVLEIVFGESGDPKYLPFFEKHLDNVDGFSAVNFFTNYQSLALKVNEEKVKKAVGLFETIALDFKQSPWRRLASTKALNDLRNEYRTKANEIAEPDKKEELEKQVSAISEIVDEIKSKETDKELQNIYSQFQLIDKT